MGTRVVFAKTQKTNITLMSEKTTIGGVVYETVGSSSSNLLLKSNGTIRVQWGNKLIDLIKNGKIASGTEKSEQVFVISDESELGSDGVYVLDTDAKTQLWVCKDGEQYNITGTDLYISAIDKQEITAEQKHQAMLNLGLIYSTLEEAQESGIQNGFVYITDTKQIYTVREGIFEEFQATLKTVTVEEEEERGDVINSSVKIVLSIASLEHLVITSNRIYSNTSIYVKDSEKVCSETSSEDRGYRLYIERDVAHIDSDVVNARQ